MGVNGIPPACQRHRMFQYLEFEPTSTCDGTCQVDKEILEKDCVQFKDFKND